MTQPTPTHTHIWDGSRDLPDWLTGHHWTAGQLVIRTPDGDTRPQAGWWLIGWTDGSVTAATPTVAERVYGADGIAGRLARAEAALARQAQETATWRATANTLDAGGPGTPRARAEQAEAANDRIRRLAARIRQGVPWAANFDNLADRIEAALDGTTGLDIPVDKNRPDSGNPQVNSGGELDNPADNQTAPDGLRALLAHTLRTTPNRHATTQLGFPDHHGPSEGYLGWCALCTRDVDALTEALLAVMVAESTWLKAGPPPAYRELLTRLDIEHAKSIHNATHATRDDTRLSLDGIAAGLHIAIAHALTVFEGHEARQAWMARRRPAATEPAHNDGPSIAECRDADRTWPLQKTGE